MELNEELCKSDFFDFVCPSKTSSSVHGVHLLSTCPDDPNGEDGGPFIDPLDYTDGNNNNMASLMAPPGPLKSFLEEMLAADGLNENGQPHHHPHQVELLGTFTWINSSSDPLPLLPQNTPLLSSTLDHTAGNWEAGVRGSGGGGLSEVTTLTNLLDPLFVSFEDSPKMDSYFSTGDPQTVISSDLISSTFLNESSDCPSTSESDIISWQKVEGMRGDEDESLLRTALQSKGKTEPEMTELRKVLSFPPLRSGSGGSGEPHQQIIICEDSSSNSPYYELKVLDSVFVDPDALIPNNVEELVLSRIHLQSQSQQQQQQKQEDEDGGKVNSTTTSTSRGGTLTTKWTYMPQQSSTNPSKTIRRRCKKTKTNNNSSTNSTANINKNGSDVEKQSPQGMTNLSERRGGHEEEDGGGGEGGQGGRKERSLHYCTICSKGFKDKYSVNVHVRTHTGEKPFSCTLCGKNFRQKAHLAKHYQTHAAKAAAGTPKQGGSANKNRNTQPTPTSSSA